MVKLYKGSTFVITEAQFAIHSQVVLQPNCTERLHVDERIMGYFKTAIFTFPTVPTDGEVIQRKHFCHHGGTICHP